MAIKRGSRKTAEEKTVVEPTAEEVKVEEKVEEEKSTKAKGPTFNQWWETEGQKILKRDVSRRTLLTKALKAGKDATSFTIEEVNAALREHFGDTVPTEKDLAKFAFGFGK